MTASENYSNINGMNQLKNYLFIFVANYSQVMCVRCLHKFYNCAVFELKLKFGEANSVDKMSSPFVISW